MEICTECATLKSLVRAGMCLDCREKMVVSEIPESERFGSRAPAGQQGVKEQGQGQQAPGRASDAGHQQAYLRFVDEVVANLDAKYATRMRALLVPIYDDGPTDFERGIMSAFNLGWSPRDTARVVKSDLKTADRESKRRNRARRKAQGQGLFSKIFRR